MKLDYLFFGAHPDDVELSCAGTIFEAISRDKKIGIIDLTQGELGTRGSATIRLEEAKKAKDILGIHNRENLCLQDGFLKNDEASILKIITTIRIHKPEFVFANALEDRHPDHAKAADMVHQASFLAGLKKIETNGLQPWRPKQVFFYIQDKQLEPHIIIDISKYFEHKKNAIAAYSSQFYSENKTFINEPETYISSQFFWETLEVKAKNMGQKIGVKYGEGFCTKNFIGLQNIESLLPAFF